jgi:hypothetical protein
MDQYSHGRKFRLRGWHIWLVLVAGFVGMVVLFVLSGKSGLEKEIAAIRAAGYPTNFAEQGKYYSIPEGVPNAADVYSKAFDAYQEPSEELKKHLPIWRPNIMAVPRGPLDSDSVEAIISHVQANKDTLEFLDKAAAIEHCRYDLDFSQGMTMSLPYGTDISNCARLLAAQTLLLAHRSNGDAVVKNIAKQLAQAESLKKEPILTSQLSRMGCIAFCRQSVEYTLNQMTLTNEQLTALQQQLSQVYRDNPMVMGVIGERCFFIELFRNIYDIDLGQMTYPSPPPKFIRIPGVSDRNIAMLLKLLGQCMDAMNLPAQQRLTRYREISAEADDLSIFYSLTKMGVPAIEAIFKIDPQATAQIDCAIVALGIERYRLAKGSLPKVLDDLVPRYIDEVPIDPFDGKPVRYKLTEPGYIVYSIGEDGTDEGGLEKGEVAQRGDPYDWPFIVEH